MGKMTERSLTLRQLVEQAKSVGVEINLFGATAEYLAKFHGIGVEISKHYHREELGRLPKDIILPAAIAEKYFEFRDYHNSIHLDDPLR